MAASSVRRGSTTTSRAPRSAAWRMRAPVTGCASVTLAPTTITRSAPSMSARRLVAAPVPNAARMPAADGA